MKSRNFLVLTFTTISFVFISISCSTSNQDTITLEEKLILVEDPNEVIKHGEYLVTVMGCNDCHSPKRMGPNGPEIIPELMLSGYPSDRPIVKFDSELIKAGFPMFYPDLTAGAGPWGISFSGNITPHETGIGNWTEEQFRKAITQGKFKGLDDGRMLLPSMPWFNYIALKNEDVHAMFMYLNSIDPVENVVPAPISPENM